MYLRSRYTIYLLLIFTINPSMLMAQKFVANYDEEKIPAHTLPNPLSPGGKNVTSRADWESYGRSTTLEFFNDHVYGKIPKGFQPKMTWKIEHEDPTALGGIAIRQQYLVTFENKIKARLLVYIPRDAKGPVPGFLGLNFRGNQLIEADPAIIMEKGYVIGGKNYVKKNRSLESSRGTGAERWPAKLIVSRGYALATACCSNFDPDFHDGFKNGLHSLDQKPRNAKSWGTITAWSYGMSRMLDLLTEIKEIDGSRISTIGHSRLGKTALWAAATDPRFAMAISNNSGCGGAALSMRAYGETVQRINGNFPHWFNDTFKKYNKNEAALPIDQHQLIALVAPRPIYVASATQDQWADPTGEFLALKHAVPVYELYQESPFGDTTSQPKPGKSTGNLMRYHIREGKHNITPEDWEHYLDFADRWLAKP